MRGHEVKRPVADAELERLITTWLEAEPDTTPVAPVDAAIAFAYDHPRRRSFAWLQRDPMSRPAWSTSRPMLLVAAVVGLLALTIGGAALLSAPPDSEPTPNPSLAPGGGFLHPILVGDPIDAELLGAWVPDDDYLGVLDVAFHTAQSEMCVATFHTNQDCMVLTDPRNDFDQARGTFGGGIVVDRDGRLVYRETLGSPIRSGTLNRPCFTLGVDEVIEFRIEGDRLHLAPSGECWPVHDTGWWHRP
jgi:hypothetical protein